MNLPFTSEQFFSVFKLYNQAIWPGQIVAYLLGLSILAVMIKNPRWSGRFVIGALALFWIWMGAVYHIIFFSMINPAAWVFGILFIVQGIILAIFGIILNRLEFGFTGRLNVIVGALLIFFSMLFYPLLGHAFGHIYPASPMFGVAPCPATIFTFGVFLFARTIIPCYLFILPLLWSLIGMSAAINLHVPQDYGLVVAGIIGTIMIFMNNKKIKRSPSLSDAKDG